jgi:TolB protein
MSARASLVLAVATAAALAWAIVPAPSARADQPPTPAGSAAGAPDESVLGTVEVNGSAQGLLPLPKLAIVPIVSTGSADSLVNLVVRRDLELSGQFEVLDDAKAPAGPFTHTTPIDPNAWRDEGAEFVLRVFAQPAPTDSARTELVAEAFLVPTAAQAAAQKAHAATGDAGAAGAPESKPAARIVVPTKTVEVRPASHRLVDQILGALTGRPGGFASQMVYAEKVGRWRQVFALDSDGFNLRSVGPSDATALSPAFGPGEQIFYALSRNYSPFQVVFGPNATPVPMSIRGSVMGLAFNADRSRMALTVMDGGQSQLWIGDRGLVQPTASPPFANHPVFGPLGKLAFVAGSPVQRVFVGDSTPGTSATSSKAVSPSGFMASAPVFCDTPQGLLVIYTVGVGTGADIIATDSAGGALRRLTQHEGANTYAACSPDGRLVAFFSTGKKGQGAGLFIMPIQRPWLAKKVSGEVGEALRWEPLPPPPK